MIVITIAGESKRFFDHGYRTVKYKLKLSNSKSILWNILFYIDINEKLIIVANKKFNDFLWIKSLLISMSFKNFEIVEIESTNGQLTSAVIGIANSKFYDRNTAKEQLIIFNGDTIRKLPFSFNIFNYSGMLEVFVKYGSHWSFVDNLGEVNEVREKERISKYCSTGLYIFSSIKLFMDYSKKSKFEKNEKFIAPLYNELIKDNLKVFSFLSDSSFFNLCGTPEEYIRNYEI